MVNRLSTRGDKDQNLRRCAPRSAVVGVLALIIAAPARAEGPTGRSAAATAAPAPEPAVPPTLAPTDPEPASAANPPSAPAPRATAPYFPVSLALLYPISTNIGVPELRTNVSLGVLLGRVGAVDGVQLGLVNSVIHDLHGVQMGGASLIDGSAAGAQLGGVFAFTDGPLHGVQIAGLLSWSGSSLSGLQLAGAANQARHQVRGVQAAGGVNLTYGDVEGMQIGAVNIGKVRGVQIGLVNVSADAEGTQIGVINVARRSSGLQIGVLNVTDNLEGEALGVASVPRIGGVHLVVWGSNSLTGNLGVKFASKFTYSIVSAAIHREDQAKTKDQDQDKAKDTVYGVGLTLGIRLPFLSSAIDGLTLGSDFGGYRLFRDPSPNTRHDELYKTRLVVTYEIARHFSIFVGGGAHVSVRSHPGEAQSRWNLGPELCAGLEL
jgi:hypothetical protein